MHHCSDRARMLREAPAANDRALNGTWRGAISGETITVAADPSDWTYRMVTWRDGIRDRVRNGDVALMVSSGILERIGDHAQNARNHAENDETAENDLRYQNAP